MHGLVAKQERRVDIIVALWISHVSGCGHGVLTYLKTVITDVCKLDLPVLQHRLKQPHAYSAHVFRLLTPFFASPWLLCLSPASSTKETEDNLYSHFLLQREERFAQLTVVLHTGLDQF